ncbi:MAG: helix-turn-helix domain-containing protein [Blastocatellia bacterium]|nr:helix-turn-helix domain-containing protein [Blastocatellia bacterium]
MQRLLTVREVAPAVGLSPHQLYQAIAERQFPAVRIGRRVRIPADAVDQWIAAQIEAQRAHDAQEKDAAIAA